MVNSGASEVAPQEAEDLQAGEEKYEMDKHTKKIHHIEK